MDIHDIVLLSTDRVVYNSMPPCAGTNVYSFQAYPVSGQKDGAK